MCVHIYIFVKVAYSELSLALAVKCFLMINFKTISNVQKVGMK